MVVNDSPHPFPLSTRLGTLDGGLGCEGARKDSGELIAPSVKKGDSLLPAEGS